MKYKIPIIILVALASLIIASFYTTKTNEESEVIIENETKTQKQKVATDKIKVDIKGEVINAGVYELKTGSRVMDLVEKAGGLTENANTELINLSKKLKDENVIVELENLVKNYNIEEDLNTSYAIFMKERILAVSGLN